MLIDAHAHGRRPIGLNKLIFVTIALELQFEMGAEYIIIIIKIIIIINNNKLCSEANMFIDVTLAAMTTFPDANRQTTAHICIYIYTSKKISKSVIHRRESLKNTINYYRASFRAQA